MENPNTETAYIVGSFRIWISVYKAPKSMYFEKENPIT